MKKNFINNTRVFLTISAVIVVVALVMQLFGVGINFGIDFTGGSLLNYSVGEDYDVKDVSTILAAAGYTDAQITKAAPITDEIALRRPKLPMRLLTKPRPPKRLKKSLKSPLNC